MSSYNVSVPINFIFVCGPDAWLAHSIAKETAATQEDRKNNFNFLFSLDPRTTAATMKERFIKGQQKQQQLKNNNNSNNSNNFMMMNNINVINKKDLVSFFVSDEMNLQIFPKIEELIFRSMLFTVDDDDDDDEDEDEEEMMEDENKAHHSQILPPVLDFVDVSANQNQTQNIRSNNNNNSSATTFLQLINSEITIIVDAPIFTRTRDDRDDLFVALSESLKNKISIHHGQNNHNNNANGSSSSPTIFIDWKMGHCRQCLEVLSSHRQDQNTNNSETPQQENLFHTWAYGWELGQRVKNEILANTTNTSESRLDISQPLEPSYYKKLLELSKAVYDSVSHHESFFTSIDFLKSSEVRIPKIHHHRQSSIALFLPLDAIDLLGQIQLQEIVHSWFRELAVSEKSSAGHAPRQRFVIWTPPLFSKDMMLFPHRSNNDNNMIQQKCFQNCQLNWNRAEDGDAECIEVENDDETELLNNYSSTKFPYSVWPSILSKALGNISENAAQCPMIGLWYKKTVEDENNSKNNAHHHRIVHSNQRELRTMLGFLQSSINLDLTQSFIFCPSKQNEVRFYQNIFGIKNLLLHNQRSNNGNINTDKEEEEKVLNDYLASSANNNNEYYIKWLKYFSSSPIPCTVPTDCIDDQNFNENQLRVFIPPDAEELIMYEGDELFGGGNGGNNKNNSSSMMTMMTKTGNNNTKNDQQEKFSNNVSPSTSASKQQKSSSKRQTQPFSLVRAVSQKIAKLSGITTASTPNQLPNSIDIPGAMTKALQEQLDQRLQQTRTEKGLPQEPAFTNSYILFCHLTREQIKRSNGGESLSMKALSDKWNALSNEQRHEYMAMIRADDERYRQECAEYVARRKKEINNPLVFVDTPLEEIQKVREVFYQEHGIQIVPNSAKRGRKNAKMNNVDGGCGDELLRSGTRRQRNEDDQHLDEQHDEDDDDNDERQHRCLDGEMLDLDDDPVHPDQFEIRPVRNSAPTKKKQPQNSASSKSYDTQKDIDEIFAKHLGHFD